MKRGAAGTTANGRPETMEQLIPLEDDCMFTAVMRNKDACIGFLDALFG